MAFDVSSRSAAVVATIGFSLLLAGCVSASSPGERILSADGLYRAEIDSPGVLEIRDHHGVGGYDAFVVPEPELSYERETQFLTDEAAERFRYLLRQSLVEAIDAADIAQHEEAGRCVLQLDIRVVDLIVNTEDAGKPLARMVAVLEFRDSTSGQALLRYARRFELDYPPRKVTTDQQLRTGLIDVVEKMNPATSLGGADIALGPVRQGCEGTLAARGRAQRSAERAR